MMVSNSGKANNHNLEDISIGNYQSIKESTKNPG